MNNVLGLKTIPIGKKMLEGKKSKNADNEGTMSDIFRFVFHFQNFHPCMYVVVLG